MRSNRTRWSLIQAEKFPAKKAQLLRNLLKSPRRANTEKRPSPSQDPNARPQTSDPSKEASRAHWLPQRAKLRHWHIRLAKFPPAACARRPSKWRCSFISHSDTFARESALTRPLRRSQTERGLAFTTWPERERGEPCTTRKRWQDLSDDTEQVPGLNPNRTPILKPRSTLDHL